MVASKEEILTQIKPGKVITAKLLTDITNLAADTQTNANTAIQQAKDYATSIKDDMDIALIDVQSKGSGVKADMDTAKTSVDDYATEQKSNIDKTVDDVNTHATTQKQAIHNIVADVQSTADTAKTDINAVLPSVQAQVSDLKTKIENLPDIPKVYTDLAEVKSYIGYTDSDIYGIEIDMVNKTFKRLAGAVGKNGGADFDNINAYKRRRCILTNDGVVLAYHGESNYTESGTTNAQIVKNGTTYPIGTPVQVMVEQPKFYYKVVPLVVEPIANGKGYHMRKGRYYISDYPKTGFKVHPAFIVNGAVRDKIYLSAYEGSLYDASANAYILNDEQVADFNNDMLSSIAGAKPISGLTQDAHRANMRKLAQKRGAGWQQSYAATFAATQLLFLVEYATFNMQSVLGDGAVFKKDDGTSNLAEPTGGTTNLGNKSGNAQTRNNVQVVSYRGEENLYGNIWKFVDGMNPIANGVHSMYIADHDFAEKQSAGAYKDCCFTLAKTNGYVSAFGYSADCDWLFVPTETKGNTSVPVGDGYRQNYAATDDGGWRTVRAGAYWDDGAGAGGFYWTVDDWSGRRVRYSSGRLVYAA